MANEGKCTACLTPRKKCKPLDRGSGSCCPSCFAVGRTYCHGSDIKVSLTADTSNAAKALTKAHQELHDVPNKTDLHLALDALMAECTRINPSYADHRLRQCIHWNDSLYPSRVNCMDALMIIGNHAMKRTAAQVRFDEVMEGSGPK